MRVPDDMPLRFALAEICRSEARKEANAAADLLFAAQTSVTLIQQRPCAYDAAICTLLALSDHPAAVAVLAAQPVFPWAGNSIVQGLDDDAAHISDVAVLVSPDGPIIAPDIRLGLY
ncbi:MAG: hypothetical protein WBC95_16550 [Albidovulum sp.]